MARRWTLEEETFHREQLKKLYVVQNLTIGEIASRLKIAESSVFQRLARVRIPSTPAKKVHHNNQRGEVVLPGHSRKLAEFYGIMLGDGHISHFQTIVTLGNKELGYVEYVAHLMGSLFGIEGKICKKKNDYRDVYIGSVAITAMLRADGLVSNKVAYQVDVPPWIFEQNSWMQACLRGFFDTDGSIYRLRFGRQISLTNHSLPLLYSLRRMLIELEYNPSEVSAFRVYLTRKADIDRFFKEVRPANAKHLRRFEFISDT